MRKFEAGHYVDQGHYRAFTPSTVLRQWVFDDPELLLMLGQADRELGRLDMFSEFVPDLSIFISLHVGKEATQSSKIEGTQTRMEDLFIVNDSLNSEQRSDKIEVQNYIRSLFDSLDHLSELPLSTRMLRSAHKTLLKGSRGKHKLPGQFRKSQNWIGGSNISTASFVPPAHTGIAALMSDLEKFLHDEKHPIPHLLKIAIAHYQFETVHPFLDGNGRVGRLMIPLYLAQHGILKQPVLYMSDHFERNREAYYTHLAQVRSSSEILPWLKFFLQGVIDTAKSGIAAFEGILKLQKELDHRLPPLGKRSANARRLIDHLFTKPIITSSELVKQLQVSPPTAHKLLKELQAIGILVEITGNARNKQFAFEEYLELFRS